ncbi:MAG: SpoIIE family protein phosphatase [Chitinivibrionales bacterium]|nr:SpoIIE family protein phosphatase [Chitinivibrionales bacterium]MBD3394375.1 SpoIIE family protein phosphatase [Chitinivibrionales bacterium]
MKRISLKYQFSFMVALLVSAAIAAISYFALRHEKQSLIQERQLRGRTLVRNLATASGEALLSGNELDLFAYCKDITDHEEDAEQVIILGSDGTIIAHSDPQQVGSPCTTSVCDSVRSYDGMRITPVTSGPDTLYDYSMPMTVMNKRIGSVRVVMSNQSILKKMGEVRREILRLSLMAVLAGILLSILLVHVLVKPITKLVEAAERVGGGDFEHRITVRSRNEIGELAQTFNHMGERLLKRKRQIAALNEAARSLSATHEQQPLLDEAANTVNRILLPNQCIVCIEETGRLIARASTGFADSAALRGAEVVFPKDILDGLADSDTARIYPLATLEQSLGGLDARPSSDNGHVLVVPMTYEGVRKGIIVLVGKQHGEEYTETDREFSQIVAASTTISMLNIELLKETAEKARMEAELKTAEIVQQTLFPKKPIKTDAVEVYGYFKSASETGGDWYGFIEDPDANRLSVLIGDVTGHGVPAALVTATANSFVRTVDIFRHRYNGFVGTAPDSGVIDAKRAALADPLGPAQLLSTLNSIILASADRQLAMTFFASTLDLRTRSIRFANAGHEMPIIVRNNGTDAPEALVASGPRLGDKDTVEYEEAGAKLFSGDRLVWYTDGITECLNPDGEEYGSRRFLRRIRTSASLPAEEMCQGLVDDVFAFANGEPLNDDVTLVVARML